VANGLLSIRNRVAIVGTGLSTISRRTFRSLGDLAIEAVSRAAEDAGISVELIDGLAVYPNPSRRGAGTIDGIDFVGGHYLGRTMNLRSLRWVCAVNPGSLIGSVVEAVNAVAAGACTYAVAWRAMHNPEGKFGRYREAFAEGGEQFRAPYGLGAFLQWFAPAYSRYLWQYGATREHMAAFIVTNRAHAALNPASVFYGQSLSREDYLSSRMISEPLSLLDCDMAVDGAGAVIVTTAERAKDLRRPPAYVTGYGLSTVDYGRSAIWTLEDFETGFDIIARNLWASCGLSAKDVDVPELYDGFSFLVYLGLEAFGFCRRGEAFEFIQDGRIALGGELPLTPSGGSLGMGRLHGIPQLIDAVMQIQGRSGPRQVEGANIALAASGAPFGSAGAVLLSRDKTA
jgi:acetyl-CoA acetyltransferase